MKRILHSALLLSLLPALGLAQDVTFRGKVEDVSGTTGVFVLDGTDTSLTSAVLDLNDFVGLQVEIAGQWNGSVGAPSVAVEAIEPVPEAFEIGGGAKIGEVSSLSFSAEPGSQVVGFLSLAPSFLPVSDGVIFLDPGQIVLIRGGLVGGSGVLEIPFQIPNDPSIVGIDLYGQGATSTGGAPRITNPDHKTIDD